MEAQRQKVVPMSCVDEFENEFLELRKNVFLLRLLDDFGDRLPGVKDCDVLLKARSDLIYSVCCSIDSIGNLEISG